MYIYIIYLYKNIYYIFIYTEKYKEIFLPLNDFGVTFTTGRFFSRRPGVHPAKKVNINKKKGRMKQTINGSNIIIRKIKAVDRKKTTNGKLCRLSFK